MKLKKRNIKEKLVFRIEVRHITKTFYYESNFIGLILIIRPSGKIIKLKYCKYLFL